MISTIRHVIKENRWREKKRLSIALFSWFAAVAVELSLPYIANKIVHVLETQGNIQDFYFWIAVLAWWGLLYIIIARVKYGSLDYRRVKLFVQKKHYYVDKLLSMDHHTIQTLGTGKAMTRIEKGADAEVNMLSATIHILVNSLWKGAIIVATLIYFERRLLPLILGVFVVTITLDKVIQKHLRPTRKKIVTHAEETGRQTARMVMEHTLVRLHNTKDKELQAYQNHLKIWPEDEKKLLMTQYAAFDMLHIGVRVAELFVFVFLWREVLHGRLSLAHLLLLITFVWRLRDPISTIIHEITFINKIIVQYQKLRDFVAIPQTIHDGDKEFIYQHGEIILDDISFAYPDGKKIIENFSFTFAPGKTTALVGHSWSWKTTLLTLLLRLYDTDDGQILYDGQAIQDCTKASLYKHIGYVSQQASIFDGTVQENLLYGLDLTTAHSENDRDQQISRIIDMAHCHFVYDLPDGLQTQLWEKWVKLSGGEKQRLAIARLMLRNPEIILLDEPTSALDSISEEAITQALKTLTQGKTVIVIAHRLQTVMEADIIVVMESGQIIEQWNHSVLLKKWWTYATLVDIQNGRIMGS